MFRRHKSISEASNGVRYSFSERHPLAHAALHVGLPVLLALGWVTVDDKVNVYPEREARAQDIDRQPEEDGFCSDINIVAGTLGERVIDTFDPNLYNKRSIAETRLMSVLGIKVDEVVQEDESVTFCTVQDLSSTYWDIYPKDRAESIERISRRAFSAIIENQS